MRQLFTLFGLLLASPLAAQTPAELAAVTPQTPESSCLGGNCRDGIGTQLLMNTADERRFYAGHFAGGEPAGEGTLSVHMLAPPDPADPVAGPHYRLASQRAGQWGPGLKPLPGLLSLFGLANTVRHDTLFHTELRLVNGLQTGTSCYWPQGSAQGSYVRETGRFQDGLFEQGTVELHGLRLLPTPTVRLEVKSGADYRGDRLGKCAQGNCADGTGVLLLPKSIQAGTFRDHHLQQGTIEVHNASSGGFSKLNRGLITLVGEFDSQGRAAARFVPDGASDVIEGSVRQADYEFGAAPSYFFSDAAGLMYVHDEAPAWLRNVYAPLVLAGSRLLLAQKARQEEAARAEQVRLARQAYEAAHPAAPQERATRTYQATDHEVTCGACGGSGYQNYTDYHVGRTTRESCRSCGGRGKTTSRY